MADQPWLRYVLGWAELLWERFDEARTTLSEALADSQPMPALLARCRYGLLLTDFFQRLHAEQLSTFRACVAELEAAGATAEALHARTFTAGLLNRLGRSAEAIIQLEATQPYLSDDDLLARGRWLRIRAAAASAQGEFGLAATLLDEALACFTARRCAPDIAKCWYEQAFLALRQHQIEPALERYLQAERSFARLDLPYRRAHCAQEQSILLARQGHYDEALERVVRALAYFSALGKDYDIARCQMQLGNLYWYTGCWEGALACYREAEQRYAAAGVVASDLLTVRRNQTLALRALGWREEAWSLLAKLAEVCDDELEAAEIGYEQAALLAETGQVDAAIVEYARVATQFERLGNQSAAANSVLEQAWLWLAQGEILIAHEALRDALPALSSQPQLRWRAEHALARCAEALGDPRAALNYYASACAIVADLRGRLASETFSSSIYAQAEQLHQQALDLAARRNEGELLLRLSDGQRGLALHRHRSLRDVPLPHLIQAEYDALVNTLRLTRSHDAGNAPEQPARLGALIALGQLLLRAWKELPVSVPADSGSALALSLPQLRAQLAASAGASWTALTYIVLDHALLTVILTPDDLMIERTAYDDDLQRLLTHACAQQYRRYAYLDLPYHQRRTTEPWLVLAELGKRLLPQRAVARLDPAHRLIIVPSGPLHSLPWAALRIRDRWLMEQAVIQIAPSLALLQQLQVMSPSIGAGALLLGCSMFADGKAALPRVVDELKAVAARLPEAVEVLVDAQATPEVVRARGAQGALRSIRLLHLASHAQLLPNYGHTAHVNLWEGALGIAEIRRLQLDGALVVLSSCDGASAELLGGDETLSLSRAFLAAGGCGVVASLWPFHDQAAVAIMDRFYAQLLRCGDAAVALATVQRALANGEGALGGGLWATPYCWGSLLLIGDGRYEPRT